MNKQIPKESIAGYECRFAVYCPPADQENDDIHLVKEIVHKTDGATEPNVRLWRNFKQPYWVTKKGCRNHHDKKEWEEQDRLLRFESTRTNLIRDMARSLGTPGFRGKQRMLQRSPYLYGSDILSTAVIKRTYQDKFPTLMTPYTMAPFDVETDVVHGTGEIIMATLSFGKKVFTAVQKSFVAGQADVHNRLQEKLRLYLGAMEFKKEGEEPRIVNLIEKRGIQWEVIFVEREIDVIKEVYKRAHEWKPDFVAIWNIDFDMPKMLEALDRARVRPEDIFCDPKVPPQYRHFRYKQGPKQKVTASGVVTPIKPSAQWHTVYCPSSFYFIDAMCAYRHIRTGSQEEPSYALDPILEKHLGARKLKFAQADGLGPLEWHQFMQSQYPLEYIIYNVFDCVSMELLDEVTNDLSVALPMFSGCSDFENFKSQPRRLADNLHYFCLERGKVIGSTSDQMAGEMDEETVGLDGWIVTLAAHLVVDNGLHVLEENPNQSTNIRAHVGDLDVSASYPNGGAVLNISKETTHRELLEIVGVSEYQRRMQGINLSGGHVNAVEFCCSLYGLPSMEELLAAFQQVNPGGLDPVTQEPLLANI